MLTLLFLPLVAAAEPTVSGRYVLAETSEDLERIHDEAVQEAIAQLPWAFRAVARSRVRSAIRSCAEMDLDLSTETFQVRCDDQPSYVHDRSRATATITTDEGAEVDVRFEVGEDALNLRFATSQGGQETRYVPEGEGLVVTRQLFSSHLEAPVAWTVRYRPGG